MSLSQVRERDRFLSDRRTEASPSCRVLYHQYTRKTLTLTCTGHRGFFTGRSFPRGNFSLFFCSSRNASPSTKSICGYFSSSSASHKTNSSTSDALARATARTRAGELRKDKETECSSVRDWAPGAQSLR